MRGFQKVIKYGAIAFGTYLSFIIITIIAAVLIGIFSVFSIYDDYSDYKENTIERRREEIFDEFEDMEKYDKKYSEIIQGYLL